MKKATSTEIPPARPRRCAVSEKYSKVQVAIDGLKASAFRFGDTECLYLKTLMEDHTAVTKELEEAKLTISETTAERDALRLEIQYRQEVWDNIAKERDSLFADKVRLDSGRIKLAIANENSSGGIIECDLRASIDAAKKVSRTAYSRRD